MFQQYLRSLLSPLRESGASTKLIDDIEGACRALGPFGEQTVEAFAAFLHRADEYERTGTIPIVPKPVSRSRNKVAAEPFDVEAVLREVRALYERSTDDAVTYGQIETEVAKLDRLKKPELDSIIQGFGLGKAKTKKAALDAIRDKISDYKKSHQRTMFT